MSSRRFRSRLNLATHIFTNIPGHSGIRGNEEANTLARKGEQTPFICPKPFCGVDKCTYKKEFQEKEVTEREKLWRNLPGLDHSKKFLRNFDSTRSKKYLYLSRNMLHLLTGFPTGHCRLRKHLMRMGLTENDECRFCEEEEETPDYLVTECLAIASQRKTCLGHEIYRSEKLAPLKPSQLLKFIRTLELESEL